MYLYRFFKEWHKNPQWSFSCCLALLLPLNDLQGEIIGMTDKNILKTQLETGIIEKPSIAASTKDSGAMSFTLSNEDIERNGGSKIVENHERNFKFAKYSNNNCHRWTQTDVVMPRFATTSVSD